MDFMQAMNAPAAPPPPGGSPQPAPMRAALPTRARKKLQNKRRAPAEYASESKEMLRSTQHLLAEPEPRSRQDLLFDLLMTQKADGRFATLSPALTAILGRRAGRLSGASDSDVTAVVVALLRREFADDQATWAAAVTKAERWLASNPPSVDASSVIR